MFQSSETNHLEGGPPWPPKSRRPRAAATKGASATALQLLFSRHNMGWLVRTDALHPLQANLHLDRFLIILLGEVL